MQRFRLVTCAAALLVAVPAFAIEVSEEANPATGAEVRTRPEQIERRDSGGMPKVPGAEPIQPNSTQPGEGARRRALDVDQRQAREQAGVEHKSWAHEITGKVIGVERRTGLVTIAVAKDKDPLVFQFIPSAVVGLGLGDEISTRSTYQKATERRPSAADAPLGPPEMPRTNKLEAETGERVVSGVVDDVDRSTGRVDMTTDQAVKLRLQFPPKVAQELRRGDRIDVEMGFSRQLDQKGFQG